MSWVQTPSEENIINSSFSWIKSLEQKEKMECSYLLGIVACAVIPLMGEL